MRKDFFNSVYDLWWEKQKFMEYQNMKDRKFVLFKNE